MGHETHYLTFLFAFDDIDALCAELTTKRSWKTPSQHRRGKGNYRRCLNLRARKTTWPDQTPPPTVLCALRWGVPRESSGAESAF